MKDYMNSIARGIAVWCDDSKQEEKIEILTYGFSLIFESLYKIVVLLIIAFLTQTVPETVIILGSFCILRYWAGGYHCRTSIGCTLAVLFIWVFSLFCSYLRLNLVCLSAMCVMGLLIVVWLAPCTTNNNPITGISIIKKKHNGAVIVVVLQIIVSSMFVLCGNLLYANLIAVPMFIEAITLLPMRKEGNTYENIQGNRKDDW